MTARPKQVVVTIRLESDVAAWLDKLARDRGMTRASYLQAVLKRNFERRSAPAGRVRTPADRQEVVTRFKEKK